MGPGEACVPLGPHPLTCPRWVPGVFQEQPKCQKYCIGPHLGAPDSHRAMCMGHPIPGPQAPSPSPLPPPRVPSLRGRVGTKALGWQLGVGGCGGTRGAAATGTCCFPGRRNLGLGAQGTPSPCPEPHGGGGFHVPPPAPRCTVMFQVLITVRGEHGGAEAKRCRTPRALPGVHGVRNPLPAAPALPVM